MSTVETKPLKVSARWRRDPLNPTGLRLRSASRRSKNFVAWVAKRAMPNKANTGGIWVYFWATCWGASGWRPVLEQAQALCERDERRAHAKVRARERHVK